MSSKKTKSADSRSYYSDDYTDYSDSFASEDDDLPPLKKLGKNTSTVKKNTSSTSSTVSGKKSTVSTVKGRVTKNAQTRQGTKTSTPRVDYVAKRMLSARRLKINELRNENENMTQQILDLKQENKYLKRTQHRQEKALERFEDQDSELPRLIQQHGDEVRSLKEQIRKYKEKLHRSERKRKEIDDEFEKTMKDLQKLKTLASDKKLAEREDLSKKLSKTEVTLEEKDLKCQELSRHVEHLQKNHRRELATEISKHRELQKENTELRDELERAQGQLKEKEKELEIKNIYSNRVLKPPYKLPLSNHSSPLPASSPNKPKKQKKSSPEVSPREKAKQLEERRREEEKRKREEKLRREKEERDRKAIEPPSMDWDSVSDSYDKEKSRKEQIERDRREHEERERREREARERQEREERLRREDEERSRRDWEDEENNLKNERQRIKRQAEERQRREDEERERQERERRDREAKELREREERDRREREDRERREREDQERRDREDRERREREDRERRAREEANRLANDAKAQEDRRKKDLLLQQMKLIDDSKSKGDPVDISPLTKKPVRELGDFPSSAERKPYTFPKPVENLHNGLPSHDDDIVEKKNKKKNFIFDDDEDDDVGGYNPSFITQSKPSPSTKRKNTRNNKSNLMESLFGDDSSKPKSSFGEDDIFSSSTKAKPVSDKKSLPWGNDTNGGSPVFGDGGNNKLLPRRPRQDVSAFHAKPTVNAVDDFDDDIEEVVL